MLQGLMMYILQIMCLQVQGSCKLCACKWPVGACVSSVFFRQERDIMHVSEQPCQPCHAAVRCPSCPGDWVYTHCRASPIWLLTPSSMSCRAIRYAAPSPAMEGMIQLTTPSWLWPACLLHVVLAQPTICVFMQPYVAIGALTTRGRPDKGWKDSQQNIADTG